MDGDNHNDVSFLIDFLAGQKILKELDLFIFESKLGTQESIDVVKLKSIRLPLKKLNLYANCFGSEENLLLFLNQFAETLEEIWSYRGAMFISNHLRKLEALSLIDFTYTPRPFNGLNLASLKFIVIGNGNLDALNESDWEALVSGLPNIESFFAEGSHDFDTDRMFSAISKGWLHLRHVRLNGIVVGKEFNQLLLKCQKLRKFEIDKKAFQKTAVEMKQQIWIELLRLSKENGLYFTLEANSVSCD